MFLSFIPGLLFAGLTSASTSALRKTTDDTSSRHSCKYVPGDNAWPSAATWQGLNDTVGGRLITAHPIAEVCHIPTYSEAVCSALKETWNTGGLM